MFHHRFWNTTTLIRPTTFGKNPSYFCWSEAVTIQKRPTKIFWRRWISLGGEILFWTRRWSFLSDPLPLDQTRRRYWSLLSMFTTIANHLLDSIAFYAQKKISNIVTDHKHFWLPELSIITLMTINKIERIGRLQVNCPIIPRYHLIISSIMYATFRCIKNLFSHGPRRSMLVLS